MHKILEEWTTMSLDGNQGWQDTDRWVIPENIPHLANETIYYLTQSYTHTRSIIELSDRSLVPSVEQRCDAHWTTSSEAIRSDFLSSFFNVNVDCASER